MSSKVKKKKSFAQKLVPLIIVAVMLYVIATFLLQAFTGSEISPTLTTCYFGFWTVEIVNLMTIKVSKVKNKYHEQDESEVN